MAGDKYRYGDLGHHFNKRLESLAPCFSRSLLLEDFKERILYSGFNDPDKKSAKQENKSAKQENESVLE